MAKFNVGDEVLVTKGVWKGLIGTVKLVNEWADCCDVKFDGGTVILRYDYLENLTVHAEEKTPYQQAIEALIARQVEKGKGKYGVTLDENATLTTEQRIEHLEEELIDALMYCEHLKTSLKGSGLTADDYQRAALRTARVDELSKDELLLNGVMGLCGEAGECIDLVKKAKFQGHELDREKLKLECGDSAWYQSLVAYALDLPLSDVLQANIDKLKARFPDGFSKERSIHREEESAPKEG